MPDAMQWEDRIVQTELGGRILNDALPAPLQRLAPGTAVRVTVEPLTPPIAAGGGTERCSTCGGPVMRCECCTTPGFDTPPASAPGGADEWWEAAECEAWAQARQHASEIGWRDLDKAESIAAAATGSLRFAILAAVRRAAEQGYQDGVNKWMPIAERAAKQEREGFVKALLAIGIEPTEDDDGRWYVAAEPDGQDFDTLKEALIFAFNLRDADREQRAAEQGRREAMGHLYDFWNNEGTTPTDPHILFAREEWISQRLAALADDEGRVM